MVKGKHCASYLLKVQNGVTIRSAHIKSKRGKNEKGDIKENVSRNPNRNQKKDMNEVWARTVDLPGLEDNISPSNNILKLICVTLLEVRIKFLPTLFLSISFCSSV